MSSPFYNSYNSFDLKPAIRFVVQDLQGLAEYVKRHMAAQKLNAREVAARTHGATTKQTVWNIVNQRVGEVKDVTLIALAKALNVPEDEIFSVVRGKTSDKEYTAEEKRMVNYYRTLPAALRPEALFVMEKLSQRHMQNGGESNGLTDEAPMITVPLSTATPRRKKTPAKSKAG